MSTLDKIFQFWNSQDCPLLFCLLSLLKFLIIMQRENYRPVWLGILNTDKQTENKNYLV